MNPEFWRGRRVLITGHTGFKGSWLTIWLRCLGSEVVGYSLPPSGPPSLFEVAGVGPSMRSIIGDVRDLEGLMAAIADNKIEIVIHMAAQSLVRYSYRNPVETYASNVMGTVNLLDAVRRARDVRVVVNVTSDKCYENREWHWGYRENDPMGGYDPYSSSKGCAELVTAAFRASFFNPIHYSQHQVGVASARAGNVIGGGDWAEDRLIPDIVRAFSEGRSAEIRNPHAVRPWQHVLEPLNGYLTLAEALWKDGPSYAEGWNFGPRDDEAQTVSWIAERMAALWGDGARIELRSPPGPHEASHLKLDCSKARARLGWEPVLPIADALEWTIEWYRQFVAGMDMRLITEQQIARFGDKMAANRGATETRLSSAVWGKEGS